METLEGMEPTILESSFFEPANLEKFGNDYFENYWPHFPIIHRPTFSPFHSPPLLVAAIAMFGSRFDGDPGTFHVASAIHDHLSACIFNTRAMQQSLTTDYLQTLLLVLAHGKMFSSRKHHEMAHIFHSAMINLFRREDAFSPQVLSAEASGSSLEQKWQSWIERESMTRLAFFAFMMDAQHAMYFMHTPVLNVNDIHLQLPCEDVLWNAATAEQWHKSAQTTCESPYFRQCLRSLLRKIPAPHGHSPYSRFILLHGLFSVATSLHTNESMYLNMGMTGPLDEWRAIISQGIETWSSSELFIETSLSSAAARLLSRMAQITMHCHLYHVHVFSGAPSLLGNTITGTDYTKATEYLKLWFASKHSRTALYHSLSLVQDHLFARQQCREFDKNIAVRPWCLYSATLVIWVYSSLEYSANAREDAREDVPDNLSLELYIPAMIQHVCKEGSTIRMKQTKDLLNMVRVHLQHYQWELLQEACITLGRLAGMSR
ncbi:hypothetical protein A1O3_02521 [Capronia epimyces CBS 606.96]|uniref:Xylanolytic transcriptional activator regulatory domain-containing protein n=1 Tax=Capronia epimyces CBS 606.96 TaxID=1182542 RepID=W9Z4P1_9EURO|nr:uncharacterized protein A1O3_02521 [Capronia epimyces CBS 606.96]EXJ89454.1 hypothetical protein A1O3_02521 [Capronia epimyces CBS 606.96]